MPIQTGDNKFGVAQWIVDPTAGLGTHTTIQAAINSASSGQTIVVRPGTYTENLTLKAGVNIVGLDSNGQSTNVSIVGKITASYTGAATIARVIIQTNSDFGLSLTGASSTLRFAECRIIASNNTFIQITNGTLVFDDCVGQLSTTGIAFFAKSGGTLTFVNSSFSNGSNSTTANTNSSGSVTIRFSEFDSPITTSSTGSIVFEQMNMDCSAINSTCLTAGGAASLINQCYFASGSASTISVGTGSTLTITESSVNSSNTNAITGLGTLIYTPISFVGSSSNINTTTQTVSNFGSSATLGSSNSGNTNTFTVTNSSNTSSSSANIISTVGGATAADPTFQSSVSGVTTWTWGIDNSVTSPTVDPWVLSQGTALGTNNVMSVATSGEINYPLQPAFLAILSANVTDVTGDGTAYTVLWNSTIFDQNSDFNTSTGTFTAPVTGRYLFQSTVDVVQLQAATNAGNSVIITSNRNYRYAEVNWGAVMTTTGTAYSANGSCLADMDAADTATVSVTVTGGTKTVDVQGSTPVSRFSGNLVA